MNTAWVALGSNLDDPQAQVRSGLQALAALPQTRLIAASSLYRTPPWGHIDQPDFINAAAALETGLGAHALLAALQGIEQAHGRRRDGQRWGPRTLDLDLLLYGHEKLAEPDLTLPHPHLAERAFVLLPLAELAPQLEIPGHGPVHKLLANLDASACRRLDDNT